MTVLIIYLSIAIGVSFACSILEAVLLSMTPGYVESVNAENARSGAVLIDVQDSLDKSLSSILILNTFAHTIGAAGVGSQAMQIFGAEWETLIAILLTLAILYFSEIIPKTVGATYWKTLAVPAAYIILWLVKLLYPLVWLATRITVFFSSSKEKEVTRDEIIAMASLGQRDGNLHNQESQYLSNVLSLQQIKTEAVLTPRSVVHMLDQNLTVKEALEITETSSFSRMPIYADGVDDITGQVLLRSLYEQERNGHGEKKLAEIAIPLYVVSEKLPIQQLLDEFIKQRAHLFLVHDEFGQTSGIVSMEDAIETLLGREIMDESDKVEDMQMLAREKFRARLRGVKKYYDTK